MRIILDLQGTQGESSYRGIGRYTLGLAKAIARNAGEHEVWLVLNAAFPGAIDTLRAEFSDLVDRKRIRIFHPSGDCAEIFPENILRARAAEKLREAFLGSLNPDLVQNFSLFEGFLDNTVTSIGAFETNYSNAATLYDLIPLANPDTHLANAQHKAWYFRKINSLRRADHLLAISKYSRAEALNLLQLPEPTVSVVGGGIEDIFRPITLSTESKLEVWGSYGIVRSFILSLHSGTEPHKNAKGLIESHALLPEHLRRNYQLVLAGNIPKEERDKLYEHASIKGLTKNDLVVTGRIDQTDLAALYNSCQLYVCPSFHEGLGLPPLEAMACGAPAIGSNLTAVPEVIGRDDALFNPADPRDIAAKISEILDQPDFLRSLKEHGREHVKKFTWDACAQRALSSFEQLHDETRHLKQKHTFISFTGGRAKLAVVAPMPPEKTGIADYCAELIPMLSRHYDITLVVDQVTVKDTWAEINTDIRNLAWFEKNASQFDHILYQVGNSPFHKHMFELMERFAGVLVLHDFFLSSAMQWMSESKWKPLAMENALYRTHGYHALLDAHTHGMDYAKLHYPCNGQALAAAAGIIVHSKYTQHKVINWRSSDSNDVVLIPHLRALPPITDFHRISARKKLGLHDDDFLVVSFGLLDPTKLNHRLLEAWLCSHLATDPRCRLVFVGEQHGGDYGQRLSKMVKDHGQTNSIIFTGFADRALYQSHLKAADAAVQLRTSSRGETSGTVLDCLAYGIPLVINAHGTNTEIPADIVDMLPDEFEMKSLGKTLERLWRDKEYRQTLSAKGRKYINEQHHPANIAQQYHEAIEQFSQHHWRKTEQRLVSYAANLGKNGQPEEFLRSIARAIVANRPIIGPRTLWLDVTSVAENDLKTGIERVTRAVALGLLSGTLDGYRVELVQLDPKKGGYKTATEFTQKLLGLPAVSGSAEPVVPRTGDIFFGLDLVGVRLKDADLWFADARKQGATIFFMVYDLLPITQPEYFPEGSDAWFKDWLSQIVHTADGLICISKSTADELQAWVAENSQVFNRIPKITFSHLGANMDASKPTDGTPDYAENVLAQLDKGLSFLMVGTIEPRKAHAQILSAFEHLWDKDGLDVNLIIVGKEGWKGLPEKERSYISNLVARLQTQPKSGKNLYWLEGISDEFLSVLYSKCHALIAASWDEGFGLPLIEASRHDVHLIARDIPIFKEVAGSHAYYFSASNSEEAAHALINWIESFHSDTLPTKGALPTNTWNKCCREIGSIITAI